MKEQITLRLYEQPAQRACCEVARYSPSEDTRGWNYVQGDQIGLHEKNGGYLIGLIDSVDQTVRVDEVGRYRVATAWTQD